MVALPMMEGALGTILMASSAQSNANAVASALVTASA
jgi:hypothetical protein